jgi:putative FmdB family regulatory protein
MPIYDYRCVSCANEVEVIHAIDAPGPTECDVCGGVIRKALSAPAIHFKGSGWAKKDAQKASKAASTSSKAKDDATTGTGTDANKKNGKDGASTKSDTSTTKTEAKTGAASSSASD